MLTPTFADQTSEIIATNDDFQLVEIQVTLHVPSDNVLPWGAVYGTIKDHVVGYPVIIQIYNNGCLLYTSPSPRDRSVSRMPSSA